MNRIMLQTNFRFRIAAWHVIYDKSINLSKSRIRTLKILDSNSPFLFRYGLLQIALNT